MKFGGNLLHENMHRWSIRDKTLLYSAVKLFSKYSNVCHHGTWTLQMDGQMDGWMT